MAGTLLMLAHTYKNQDVAGWYVSEKLDGQRAYWDGGISRGLVAGDVPWANTERGGADRIATGLWSRYGNVVSAPDWWLDTLPRCPLDGELYCHGLLRQQIRSIVSRHTAGAGWNRISYYVFDVPPYSVVFSPRRISSKNYNKVINCFDWVKAACVSGNVYMPEASLPFRETYDFLNKLQLTGACEVHDQGGADFDTCAEGVVIRDPDGVYACKRSQSMLKVKHINDAEGIVVGYRCGKGKYLGMLGTVVLDIGHGRRLEVSGFTDYERRLPPAAGSYAADHAGGILEGESDMFAIGSSLSYKYLGLSKDGIPQEARYRR